MSFGTKCLLGYTPCAPIEAAQKFLLTSFNPTQPAGGLVVEMSIFTPPLSRFHSWQWLTNHHWNQLRG
ncbi:hypothetical protein ES703_59486 [subsurface metagenome]